LQDRPAGEQWNGNDEREHEPTKNRQAAAAIDRAKAPHCGRRFHLAGFITGLVL